MHVATLELEVTIIVELNDAIHYYAITAMQLLVKTAASIQKVQLR
jgi:hypothetical protein